MPASRQSRYKERYDKLLDDSLAVVQPRDFSSEELAQTAEDAFKRVPGAVMVPVERIEPNPDNPRHSREDAAMEPLAASIAERGLLQPLVVRRDADRPGYYVVIAGSRRLLAARLVRGDPDQAVRARVAHLPCIIKDVSDQDAFADALLENLARADLSRAETMDALLRLHRDYGWSGNQISRRIGRSQGDVSELLAIAQDAELSELVREDKVRPSTATIIKRMPKETRAATIADLQAGKALTIDEARRRYQATRRPAMAEPPTLPTIAAPAQDPGGAGVSNSIPPATGGARPDGALDAPRGGERVLSSRPSDAPTPTVGSAPATSLPHGSPDATGRDRDQGRAAATSVREHIEAIVALAAMVDGGTPAGQAVLAAVRRDLSAAHDKLAAHVKQLDQRDK